MSHVVITSADDERTDPVMLRSNQRALHIAISSIAPDSHFFYKLLKS